MAQQLPKQGTKNIQGVDVTYKVLPCGNYDVRIRTDAKIQWTAYRRFKEKLQFPAWWDGLDKLDTAMQVVTAYESNIMKGGGCGGNR